ncbi:hypothetical protein EV363DRAFT_1461052 [Boletus edulis]|nr:hypothetical protein EV363DRAFT_1461052 [Boletus edulis]
MESTLLEHPRSPTFMDAPFTYDSLSNLEPYLRYPQSPYGVSTMARPSSSSPRLDFNTLNVTDIIDEYSYTPSANYTTASPGRPYTPPDNGISPLAIYNLGGSELSSDGLTSGRRSHGSGTHSPSSVHSVPYASDDDEFQPTIAAGNTTDVRHETIRRQHIELEQRRRDELRNGYRRLKDALPMTAQQLQTRVQQAENEVQRLRTINEVLMLGTQKPPRVVGYIISRFIIAKMTRMTGIPIPAWIAGRITTMST